jgi:hypothetical protein
MVISIAGPLLESGCGLQVRRQDRRCGFLDEKAACPSHYDSVFAVSPFLQFTDEINANQ